MENLHLPDMLRPLMGPLDLAAVAGLLTVWLGAGWLIENRNARHKSVSVLMADYRREWMQHAVTRDPRVFDAMIVTSLREGTAFFASACMIAIGGGVALLGNVERLTGLARDLEIGSGETLVWEVKLLLPILILTNAFLKFVWANRIFGYCSVLMGAVPNDTGDPRARHRAWQAGELNVAAARSFNRGLRSVYFALGACVWLLGALPLMVATAATLAVVLRREYASRSRQVLREIVPPDPPHPVPGGHAP